MYGFVLVLDCTIHFINVLNTERAKRARKKNMWHHINCQLDLHYVFSAALFLIPKYTIIMFCHIKKAR